jgi:hypothetical protein
MSSEFDGMTSEGLKAAIASYYLNGQKPNPEVLPPGIDSSMSEKVKQTASDLYTASIMAKAPGQITPDEATFLKAAVRKQLLDMGY